MNKILSIIIPSYNMEKYLDHCINSLVVSDELMEFQEIIIVNDGSKDKTLEIARNWESKYPDSIVVIDKPNGNYGSCINKGLAQAHGKYIKVLDADDSFETKNYEEFLAFLQKNDVDFIISDFDKVNESGKLLENITYPFISNLKINASEFNKEILKTFAMHAVTYKTENLRNLNYVQSEGISYTDQEWIFLPLSNVQNFVYFNKVVYKYLIGREGQTVNPKVRVKSIAMEIAVTNKIINDFITKINLEFCLTKDYIYNKLLERIFIIYHYYLIDYRKYIDLKDLNKFDVELKEKLPDVYKGIELIPEYGNFKFIKEWHKKGTNKTCNYFMFFIRRKLHNIFSN